MQKIEGGVTAAKGFEAAAAAAGIMYKDRTDMALIYSAGKMGQECSGQRREITGCYREFRHCKCMHRRRGHALL